MLGTPLGFSEGICYFVPCSEGAKVKWGSPKGGASHLGPRHLHWWPKARLPVVPQIAAGSCHTCHLSYSGGKKRPLAFSLRW